jgi:FkbM family methyltransferase
VTETNDTLVLLPSGFPLKIDRSDWMSKTMYEGTYERPLLHFLANLTLDGCIFDVGANIGVTLWHGLIGSTRESSYIAFEPSPQCEDGLQMVLDSIPRQGMNLKIALGSTDNIQTMYGLNNPKHSGSASLLNRKNLVGDSQEVQVRTLDSLINEIRVTAQSVILKIDTEGYEEQVLNGAAQFIAQDNVQIIILEVSPMLGPVNYLENLYKTKSSEYQFFSLGECGQFRRVPTLTELDLKSQLRMTEQWNLVIIKKSYMKNLNGITSGKIKIKSIKY